MSGHSQETSHLKKKIEVYLLYNLCYFQVFSKVIQLYLHCGLIAKSYLTLCDPMDCRTPGFPVHHQLPELAQTHVHRVSDAIQPSHPLSSPFLLPPIPPSIKVFSNESTPRMRWPKYWSFSFTISPSNEYSGLISFRMDWLDRLAVQGTLKSLILHHHSNTSILRRKLSL